MATPSVLPTGVTSTVKSHFAKSSQTSVPVPSKAGASPPACVTDTSVASERNSVATRAHAPALQVESALLNEKDFGQDFRGFGLPTRLTCARKLLGLRPRSYCRRNVHVVLALGSIRRGSTMPSGLHIAVCPHGKTALMLATSMALWWWFSTVMVPSMKYFGGTEGRVGTRRAVMLKCAAAVLLAYTCKLSGATLLLTSQVKLFSMYVPSMCNDTLGCCRKGSGSAGACGVSSAMVTSPASGTSAAAGGGGVLQSSGTMATLTASCKCGPDPGLLPHTADGARLPPGAPLALLLPLLVDTATRSLVHSSYSTGANGESKLCWLIGMLQQGWHDTLPHACMYERASQLAQCRCSVAMHLK